VPDTVQSRVEVSMLPEQAFQALVDEIVLALGDLGMRLDKKAVGGRIFEGDAEVGTVREWSPGEKISLAWRPKTWEKEDASDLVVLFEAHNGKTIISVEQRGWGRVLRDDGGELLGWFATEIAAPMIKATAPNSLGDWITDRGARRPSGARSRGFYKNPIYHWPNFLAILDVLSLGPGDRLVEIGCGGGAFLHEALKSGCTAAAVDHSPDMVRLATEVNADAVASNRLKISLGDAEKIPFENGSFTDAVMTGVLGFISDPSRAFGEAFRVLKGGGKFVAYTGSKEMKGTPAAPEPAASRLHFYDDAELVDLARRAGFAEARVEHPAMYEHAKKAGVPEADLEMFRGASGSQLLVATKASAPR